MNIRGGTSEDFGSIAEKDSYISKEELWILLHLHRVYLLEEQRNLIGWLRFNLFWDSIPFINMLFIEQPYRKRGYGRALVEYWEQQMKKEHYPLVMTSTASDECAQHFYYKLGYTATGGFMPAGEPYEIILSKRLEVNMDTNKRTSF